MTRRTTITLTTVFAAIATASLVLSQIESIWKSPMRPAIVADVEAVAEPIRTRSIRTEQTLQAHEEKLGDLQRQVTCHDCALICGADVRCLQNCQRLKCPR